MFIPVKILERTTGLGQKWQFIINKEVVVNQWEEKVKPIQITIKTMISSIIPGPLESLQLDF